MVSPILKWAGGKRQFLDELQDRFPRTDTRYHEPFFGGGALFFDLEPENGSINDTNARLINFYEQVRECPEELISRLRSFDDPRSDPDPDWVRAEEIRTASRILERADIHNTGFEYVTDVAREGDVVYFDPPYEPMSPTAQFTEYSVGGFGKADQKRLRDVTQELDEAGVHVILSNSGVMYEMYDEAGFYVETEGATRAINSDVDNRGEVEEIIATTVPPEEHRTAGQQGLADF